MKKLTFLIATATLSLGLSALAAESNDREAKTSYNKDDKNLGPRKTGDGAYVNKYQTPNANCPDCTDENKSDVSIADPTNPTPAANSSGQGKPNPASGRDSSPGLAPGP